MGASVAIAELAIELFSDDIELLDTMEELEELEELDEIEELDELDKVAAVEEEATLGVDVLLLLEFPPPPPQAVKSVSSMVGKMKFLCGCSIGDPPLMMSEVTTG